MPCLTSCVAPAPAGWLGPHVQAAAPGTAEDTGCGGDYPNSVFDGFDGVSAADASCGCSCGSATGGECESSLTVRVYDQDQNGLGCSNLTATIDSTETPYVDSNGSGINVRITEPVVVAAPTCAPAASETIPAPVYSGDVELCGGVFGEQECAGDDVCVPDLSASFVAAHCIYAEDDIPCPVGSDYSQRSVYYNGASDTRDCSSCSCGAAQGVGCEGTLEFILSYGNGGIVIDPPENETADNSCRAVDPNQTPAAQVAYNMDYEAEDPSSSGCSPSGGNAIGSVSATGPVTVCCTS